MIREATMAVAERPEMIRISMCLVSIASRWLGGELLILLLLCGAFIIVCSWKGHTKLNQQFNVRKSQTQEQCLGSANPWQISREQKFSGVEAR